MDFTLVGLVDSREIRFPLAEGKHLVGRSEDAEFQLAQPNISRRHAEIIVEGRQVTIKDLGSHNGTLVNGIKAESPLPLQRGDRLEMANLKFRVEGPITFGGGHSGVGSTVVPNAELSWEEAQSGRSQKRDLQSLLFRVLAKAGDLLTIPREPEEMYEPILDLVSTALLTPERIFVLLMMDGSDEPVKVASRVSGGGETSALVLSQTMINKVLFEKKSFLSSDTMNDTAQDGMMSMISQGIRSAIAVPLFDNEDVIGILYADDTRPGRTFSRDQLGAFTLLANTIAVALTHARYHEMEAEKRRQDAELATASDILDNMLPESLLPVEGYDVLASLESCFEVGGDLYDAQTMPNGRYAFLIGDVTGKGLGAALLVSHVLSLTRFMLTEGWEPQPLVTRLNSQIFSCTDYVRFTTLFLGCLDPLTGHITYVNAGHNPPYVVRANGDIEECPPTGLPVGMMDDAKYSQGEITLGSGDLLALFSDGVTETQDPVDEEYGEEKFMALLKRERATDLGEVFATLQKELAAFRGEAEIGDDVTLVTLRRH